MSHDKTGQNNLQFFTTLQAKNAGAYDSAQKWIEYVETNKKQGISPCPNAISRANRIFGDLLSTSKAA